MKLHQNENNATEIIICDDCSYDKFIDIAQLVKKVLSINYINKIGDLDSHYWDFKFKNTLYTIHYNTFCGVRIFYEKYNLLSPSSYNEINTLTEITEILETNNISKFF